MTYFLDVEALFPAFGLPLDLPTPTQDFRALTDDFAAHRESMFQKGYTYGDRTAQIP
jgi:hypothetical protein